MAKTTTQAEYSARGKRSRSKGKRGEQQAAAGLREIYGPQVRRGWQAREGDDAADVEGVPGWFVEVKRHRRVNVRAAFEQATEARDGALKKGHPGGRVVVAAQDDRKEMLAVVSWEVFLELLRNTLRVPQLVSLEAHLKAVDKALDEAMGPATSIEVGAAQRVRGLAELYRQALAQQERARAMIGGLEQIAQRGGFDEPECEVDFEKAPTGGLKVPQP
jgi:hypothetical protein